MPAKNGARGRKGGSGAGQESTVAVNRQAFHDYAIEDRFEAGIALTGTEVKSIRGGRASLREGFVRVAGGEAWLEGVHIPPYAHGSYANHVMPRPEMNKNVRNNFRLRRIVIVMPAGPRYLKHLSTASRVLLKK